MDQLLPFVIAHPLLWGALGVVVIAFIANEGWRVFSANAAISSAEAIRLMDSEEAVVVDTRASADYKKSHILRAKHIPLAKITDRAKEITRDTSKPIIIYCGAGNAASQAVSKLGAKGYTRVFALKGGFNAWQADGLPVTTK